MDYQFLQRAGALNDDRQQAWSGDAVSSMRLADWSPKPRRDRQDWGHVNLNTIEVDAEVVGLVPESFARELCVFPLAFDGERLTLAAVDPDDLAVADRLRFILAKDVLLVRKPRVEIVQAISRHYRRYGTTGAESVDSMLMEFSETAIDFDEDAFSSAPHAGAAPPRKEVTHGGYRRSWPALSGPLSAAGKGRAEFRYAGSSEQQRGRGMFFYTVEEGQRVLRTRRNGTKEILVGPRRVWAGLSRFQVMPHFVAHPGEFLILRFKDGTQQHLSGPCEAWFDPRLHEDISKQDCLQLGSKEAVVVYSRPQEQPADGESESGPSEVRPARRIVFGPTLYTPEPGEWLHTFSWHASQGGHQGVQKVPNALRFQKLWLMPDQMYHDVTDVRTADNAVITVKLMIFFELRDIERMLDATHDPIGDFVNAATADVMEFTGKHDFDAFKQNTDKLNELQTYHTLLNRAEQIGYGINNVVYRGYGAAESLQKMHDQAIEARTRLQLDRETERQSQQLEDFKLESQMARAGKRRTEQSAEVRHEIELAREKQAAELEQQQARQQFLREQKQAEAELKNATERLANERVEAHLGALRGMEVDLTAYLTQARPDRIIELRGTASPHLHLAPFEQNGGSAGEQT